MSIGIVPEIPACCYPAHKPHRKCVQPVGDCCYDRHGADEECNESPAPPQQKGGSKNE